MHKLVLQLLKNEMIRRHLRLRAELFGEAYGIPIARGDYGAAMEASRPIKHAPVIGLPRAVLKVPEEGRDAWVTVQIERARKPWFDAPDLIIGSEDNPYLMRWHVVPRDSWPFGPPKPGADRQKHFSINIYFHRFVRSDEDRALHDHPWANMSWLLDGAYREEVFATKPKITDYDPGLAELGGLDVWADPRYAALPPRVLTSVRRAGWFGFRSADTAHRVVLLRAANGGHAWDQHSDEGRCNKCGVTVDGSGRAAENAGEVTPWCYSGPEKATWSLFITWRWERRWGFWCNKGWRWWPNFVEFERGDANAGVSAVGSGCGEMD